MQNLDLIEFGARLGMVFVPFLFALCFHEFAHGLVAKWRGDRTAEMAGRLSLNPLVHADPVGTWMLPILAVFFNSSFFFGWAKPVPVNSRNLKNPRMDMFWVALAGPMSNVLMALVGTVLLGVVLAYSAHIEYSHAFKSLLFTFIQINLFLAAFNFIPIHPLDGGKVLEPFLPARWNIWLLENQNQLNIVLLIFLLLAGPVLAAPLLWASNELIGVSEMIARVLV